MYLKPVFPAAVALLAAVVTSVPIEEGFIASTTGVPPSPSGFNLSHVEAHQPSNTNGDTNYTVSFNILDSVAQTFCSISWPASAPSNEEKYVSPPNR